MPIPATTIIPIQTSITAGGSDLPRGVRVTLGSTGVCTVSAIGVRGDYITLQVIPAGTRGLAAPIAAGGSIPVVATEVTAIGDLAYSAASGETSKTSTNAVLMGRWKQVAVAANLAVIELESVA